MLSFRQQNFIDVTIKNSKVKHCISSRYEYEFKKVLSSIGVENIDWFHQFAFSQEEYGFIAVADFVFLDSRLVIELDGDSHKSIEMIKKDIKRDRVFNANGYYVLRIKTPIPSEKLSYWKVYIEEILKIVKEEIEQEEIAKKTQEKRQSRRLILKNC